MASWSQTFSVNNKYSLTLTVTEQSYSIPNNTSTVSYNLVMATAANSFTGYADYRTQISCSINGSSVFSYDASRNFNAAAASSYSETLCSGTATVTHNADGTKTCAVAASVSVASGAYSPGSASISNSLTLTTIPRASTCSWSGDFVIGTAKTITITRASSSFNHKLKFTVGSASETLPSGGTYASTSYSWTPTSGTYASQFPTQTSRTGTLVLYTYNSGTLIGSNSYTFTLKIPDAWKPSVSVTLSPSTTNAFISGTGLYVAGYSKISAAITGTAATGAAISSYTISGAFSKTVNTSSSSTTQVSGVIATSGSKTVTVTITDARGRTGSASASCTFTAYAYPAVSSLSYARGSYVGGVWTTSAAGTDLRITFTGSCSLSGNSNVMSWSIGSPVSTTGSGLTSGSSITRYKTGIGTTTAYSVTVTLTDSVGNSSSRSITVPTVEIPFVIDPTLPAIGVGAVPQTARVLELASNWRLNPGNGVIIVSLSSLPTDTVNRSFPFTAVSNLVPNTGVTVPKYAKGWIVQSGNDCSLYAVDANNLLYAGFRDGPTWDIQCVNSATAVSVTLSSTALSFSDKYCYRQGSVVYLSFTVTLSSSLAVGNTANFTITGLPTPAATYIRARSIASSQSVDAYISANGTSCGVRNLGSSTIAAGGAFQSLSFMYITV